MNRIFNTNFNHNSLDIALLIFRISLALLMLSHGIPKLNSLIAGGEVQFPDIIGIGAKTTLILAVFAEVFCSFLILLGLATRLAVLPLITTMLIAIFIAHGNDGLKEKELAIHFLVSYLVLLIVGAGGFSIDKILSRKITRARRGY